jgi:gliding motility-associated-like protein
MVTPSLATGSGGFLESNYDITYTPYTNIVGKKTLTITATGQTKVYGAADPTSYAYTLSTPLLTGDALTGALTRVAGETVGPYAINQGTLTNANYDITYVGNNFTITKKPITVTVDAGQTKEYGAANPATYTYGVSPILATGLSPLNGTLTRVAGETIGSWAIQQNDLTTANNPNYTINYIGNNFTITKKTITITATPGQTKVYGTADPTSYTYTLSTPLLPGDVLTGALTRLAGETVGPYAIIQGTLTNVNYDITFVGSNFVITALPVFIFEVPNAFTPNGDGLNDELKIISNAGISSLTSFKIFSRSGNLVFESRSLSTGWNGIYKNNLLPADIYYWTAVYVDINNQTKSKTGTVLLLK